MPTLTKLKSPEAWEKEILNLKSCRSNAKVPNVAGDIE